MNTPDTATEGRLRLESTAPGSAAWDGGDLGARGPEQPKTMQAIRTQRSPAQPPLPIVAGHKGHDRANEKTHRGDRAYNK
ncbi:hypothetical protein [Streptosporangium sp. NPDC049046]|uniref:hypothetical protein n=1 Tax=Streptosporangium sp. NPDC049046 TaxID=3155031 RepID=UPI00342E8282